MNKVVNDNVLFAGLVSIIIPVYNSERHLSSCLESAIGQSYENIEIILINDGSTDNSGMMCDEYANKDKRIKVIHKKNSGPSSARNAGIESARGEFIFFLDADDYIEKDAINLLVENYRQTKADVVIGDFRKIKNDFIEDRKDILFLSNQLLAKKDLVNYARLYLKKPNKHLLFAFSWGRLFITSIIKDNNILFNNDLNTFEDVAFNFDYLNHTNKIIFLKDIIYNHTIYDNFSSATMIVSDNPRKLFGFIVALAGINNFLKNNIADEKIEKEIGHAHTTLTIIQLIRICGQINDNNRKDIVKFVQEVINDKRFRQSLKFYSPSRGDSKVLPVLMRLKLVQLIMLICKYKANRRYK